MENGGLEEGGKPRSKARGSRGDRGLHHGAPPGQGGETRDSGRGGRTGEPGWQRGGRGRTLEGAEVGGRAAASGKGGVATEGVAEQEGVQGNSVTGQARTAVGVQARVLREGTAEHEGQGPG